MPKNLFSVWTEVVVLRDYKTKRDIELTHGDIQTIERIIRGESGGIKFHKLKGTTPTVYSARGDDERRLIFIPNGTTLVLIAILDKHNYKDLQPGFAERFYRKSAEAMSGEKLEYEEIASIADFLPTPSFAYDSSEELTSCVSYHQKFITFDHNQSQALTLTTPAVMIGDPGCGKSSLCSAMMERDINHPSSQDEEGFIVYFSESSGLAEKMGPVWILDHPVTARQAEANKLIFVNYERVLAQFGPDRLKGKSAIGEREFEKYMSDRLSNTQIIQKNEFLKTIEFKTLRSTLYHEFQIITVLVTKEAYLNTSLKVNLPVHMREWAFEEYQRYTKNLEREGKLYDPNLLLWEPRDQPFSRVYHDEALSASPAINLMLYRLTKDANIIFFADPNQENTKQMSDLDYIISKLGVNGKAATVKTLGVTYRLPPTIADLANEVLKIKQNINGGKNEKHQSDQVTCVAEHHQHPGSMEWCQLDNAISLIDRLNKSDQVYVVITHPEYVMEAKKLVGEQVAIYTVEQARGQEFETVVLYRMTDPQSHQLQQKSKKRRLTKLQQVNKLLAQMDQDLKSKPHLAKAGKVNRAHESFMNSLYIAISRITRSGFMIEAGDPQKNELHKRLLKTMTNSMRHVVKVEEKLTNNLSQVLAKAEQDLAEGRILQARAGFLKVGKTESEFEALVEAKKATDAALVESIIQGRQNESVASKPDPIPVVALSESEAAALLIIINNDNKQRLTQVLKKMSKLNPLLNVFDKKEPKKSSYFSQLMRSKKLRDVMIDHLNRNGESILELFAGVDFNEPVFTTDKKDDNEKIPLCLALLAAENGRKLVKSMLSRGGVQLFSGLTFATMTDKRMSGVNKVKQSLFDYLVNTDMDLFNRLLKGVCSSVDQAVCLSVVFEAKLNTSTLFDLMLSHIKFSSAIQFLVATFPAQFSAKYILEPVAITKEPLSRIEHMIITHGLRGEAEILLNNMELPLDYFLSYTKIVSRYFPEGNMHPNVERSGDESAATVQVTNSEIVSHLVDQHKIKDLLNRTKHDDGKVTCQLTDLLNMRRTVSDMKEMMVKETPDMQFARHNFTQLLATLPFDHTVTSQLADGRQFEVPTWFYLLDRHSDLMMGLLKRVTVTGQINAMLERLITPHLSVSYADSINLVTLMGLVSTDYLLRILKACPALSLHVRWDTIYMKQDDAQSVLLAAVGESAMTSPETVDALLGMLRKDASTLLTVKSLDALFSSAKKTGENVVTVFDLFLASSQGLRLLSLYENALLSCPHLTDYMSLAFLTGQSDNNPGLGRDTGSKVVSYKNRLKRLVLSQDCSSIVNHVLKSVPDIEPWVQAIIQCDQESEPAFGEYTWSAFAAMISITPAHETLIMLIVNYTDAMKKLPSMVWHAPVESGQAGVNQINNYAVMKKMISLHRGNLVGDFFEKFYKADYEAASKVSRAYSRVSPNFNRNMNELSLVRIDAVEMIKKDSHDILLRNLQDTDTYSSFNATYQNIPIMTHIMRSNRLKDAFLSYFMAAAEQGLPSRFEMFISVVDINQPILLNGGEECPLIHQLTLTEKGEKIIQHALDYDGKFFIQMIDAASFIKPIAYKDGGKLKSAPFIFIFLFSSVRRMFSVFRYVKDLDQILKSSFKQETIVHDFIPTECIRRVGEKLIQIGEQIMLDRSNVIFADRIVESLAGLFEIMPDLISPYEDYEIYLFGSQKQEAAVFKVIKAHVNPVLVARLLISMQANPKLVQRLIDQFELEEPGKFDVKLARELMVNGLTGSIKIFCENMLEHGSSEMLDRVMAMPVFHLMLVQSIVDGRPLLIHLLKHDSLREKIIHELIRKIDIDKSRDFLDVFNKKMLITFVESEGHLIPLLCDLMRDDLGYSLIQCLEKNEHAFYKNISLDCFMTEYYSCLYKEKIPLFLMVVLHRRSSIIAVLSGIPTFFNQVDPGVLAKVYHVGSQSISILGALLAWDDEDYEVVIKKLSSMMRDGFNPIYRGLGQNVLMKQNLVMSHGQVGFLSLFDLMLINQRNHDSVRGIFNATSLTMPELFLEFQEGDKITCRLEKIISIPGLTELIKISSELPLGGISSRMDFAKKVYRQITSAPAPKEGGRVLGALTTSMRLLHTLEASNVAMKVFDFIPELFALLYDEKIKSRDGNTHFDLFFATLMNYDVNALTHFKKRNAKSAAVQDCIDQFEKDFIRNVKMLRQDPSRPMKTKQGQRLDCQIEAAYWMFMLADKEFITTIHNKFNGNQTRFAMLMLNPAFVGGVKEMLNSITRDANYEFYSTLCAKLDVGEVVKVNDVTSKPLLYVLFDHFNPEDITMGMYLRDRSYYYCHDKTIDFSHWTCPFYTESTSTGKIILTHLDLLMMNVHLCEVAKKVINTHIKSFIELYLTPENLYRELRTTQGVTNRASIILMKPALHTVFMIYLTQKNFHFNDFAEFLNSDFARVSKSNNKESSLVRVLTSTKTGAQILSKIMSNPNVVKLLDRKVVVEIIHPSVPPSEGTVANQGLFSSRVPRLESSVRASDHQPIGNPYFEKK